MASACVLGILGGGQLGRMLALAAAPLGIRVRCYDPDPDACAGEVCELHSGAWSDRDALARFAHGCEAVTYEFENVPAECVRFVDTIAPVRPGALALETGQDREREKTAFRDMGLGVHAFQRVSSREQLHAAATSIGLPCVVKTCRGGYDGKGQVVLRAGAGEEVIARAWEELGGGALLVEQFVAFEREISMLGVRGAGGTFAAYPPVMNRHARGILRESIAPAPDLDGEVVRDAEAHVRMLMDRLDYVGVLAVEFFVVQGGGRTRLLANEMAPRVHNSGHWTIDGAVVSQFENHVRAVCGLPLGSCAMRAASAMVNLIGRSPTAGEVLMAAPSARVHLYGKDGRAGRKVGHATLVGDEALREFEALREVAARCERSEG